MELHQIRYFVALSRLRNFTRAAEYCDVSQPALTKAIQKLEFAMGGASQGSAAHPIDGAW